MRPRYGTQTVIKQKNVGCVINAIDGNTFFEGIVTCLRCLGAR